MSKHVVLLDTKVKQVKMYFSHNYNYTKDEFRIMKIIATKHIRQAAIIYIFFLSLVVMTHGAGMPVVFAEDKQLSPDIQVDVLINSAKDDMETERWDEAIISFRKAIDLGIKLPGEFHFLYGKALLKIDNYDDSLSSLSNYLVLEGREGKHFEDAITLIVEAKNKLDEERLRMTKSQRQLTKAAMKTEDGMVFVKGGML